MKKYFNLAIIYAILAMISGVFYREFTKFLDFEGTTPLAFTHIHFFVLGTIMFLILALFSMHTDLEKIKGMRNAIILSIPVALLMPFMEISPLTRP